MANKKCGVCGSEYNYCPNCEKTHSWKFYACTHEHYQVHMILDSYRSEIFDKDMTVDCFAGIGITADKDLSYLLPEVERDIRVIIGETPVKLQAKKSKKLTKTDKE